MLVLTRRPGEKIRVTCPDGTRIEVVYVKQNSPTQARIAVDAPLEYAIERIDEDGEVESS